jgi:hypothetical protein
MTKKKAAAEASAPIVAFKGFDKDMKCRGFQFEVGKTYRHDGPVRACESGFHACTEPFDVWGYYGPVDCRFAEVELSGETATHDRDSKIAAAEITIKAELTLPQFIKRAVDRVIELTKGKGDDPSGYGARIGSSGYGAQIGSSGDDAQIGSSGDGARIGSSGYGAQIGSSGNDARIGSSGYGARIEATGERVVVASAGYATRVKGATGTWVSLAEYRDGKCIGFATGCIGQNGLEPDVWYVADGGRLVKENS